MLAPTLDASEFHSHTSSPSSGPKCEKHGERITGLCLQDMHPVCSICKDYDHERHNRVDCVDAIAHLTRYLRNSASPSLRTRIDEQQQKVNILRLQLAEEEVKLQQLKSSELSLEGARVRLDGIEHTSGQDAPLKMLDLLREYRSLTHHQHQHQHNHYSGSSSSNGTGSGNTTPRALSLYGDSSSIAASTPLHHNNNSPSAAASVRTLPTFTWRLSPTCDSVTLSYGNSMATNVGFTMNYRNLVYGNWELSASDADWELMCKADKEKESWIGVGVIPMSAVNKSETANHFHMFGVSSFGQLWRCGQHTPEPTARFHEGRVRFVYTAKDNMLEIHVNTAVKHFIIPSDMLPVCPCAVLGSPHASVSVLRDSLSNPALLSNNSNNGYVRGG